MRMFIMSVIVLGALGYGVYRYEPARTYIRNVLVGPPEKVEEKKPVAKTAAAPSKAQPPAQPEPKETSAEASSAQ
jgi:hypothetical protein